MNEDLTRELTEDEVKVVVFGLGAHKASGPDGFTRVFFQKAWEFIRWMLS